MQVVILAAGRGDRFVQAGYTVPKPLIPVHGRPMIGYALAQAAALTTRPIVICPESIRLDVWNLAPPDVLATTLGVQHVQSGAAMSLLAAAAALAEDDPVVVMDCDSILEPQAVALFGRFAVEAFDAGWESAVLCFQPADDSSRYSFVRLNPVEDFNRPMVLEVAEKVRIGPWATCGVHAFKSWSLLRSAICAMVTAADMAKGEYYLAPVHNYITRTTILAVQPSEFTCIGTPEQLEAYEQAIPSAE